MKETSNAIRTIVDKQNEIINNLLYLRELEEEKSKLQLKLTAEDPDKLYAYNEKLESLDELINEKSSKVREVIESLRDNKELSKALKTLK